MLQDHLLAVLHLYMSKGAGSPSALPLKRASSIFQVDHFPVTELLSKSKNFTVYYFGVEKLKELAYRKIQKSRTFSHKK